MEVVWNSWNPTEVRIFNWEKKLFSKFPTTKNGKFFVRTLYVAPDPRDAVPFPRSISWSPTYFLKWDFLLGKHHKARALSLDQKRRRWSLVNKCFLCPVEEKSIF